uniref:Transporter, small conductance mechanosensitive ion channel (MscS) family protein n=1 Tax=Neospora caninum (strain Liverpool) TaxID=572307 RepID=A0A0F7UPN6_NEOCL|nr:TPA: transporter, small conductance mechanosensitive ion channel (MscS) family protein [Neospora caninum Liverpool]
MESRRVFSFRGLLIFGFLSAQEDLMKGEDLHPNTTAQSSLGSMPTFPSVADRQAKPFLKNHVADRPRVRPSASDSSCSSCSPSGVVARDTSREAEPKQLDGRESKETAARDTPEEEGFAAYGNHPKPPETKRQNSDLSTACIPERPSYGQELEQPDKENGRGEDKGEEDMVRGGESFSEEEGEVGRQLAHEWEGGREDEMKSITLSLRLSREDRRRENALFVPPPEDEENETDEARWETRAGRAYDRERQVWNLGNKVAGVWSAAAGLFGFVRNASRTRAGEGPMKGSARRRRNSSLHGLHLRPLFFPSKNRSNDLLDPPNTGRPSQAQRLEALLGEAGEAREERERETERDRGDVDGGKAPPGEGERPPGRGSFFPGLRAHHQRPMSAFRIRHSLTKKRIDQEVSGQGLPRPLKAQSIEATKTSKVQNWLLIQYALHYPPALFIHGRRIALTNKEITGTIAELIFNQLVKENSRPQGSPSPSLLPDLNHVSGPGDCPAEARDRGQAWTAVSPQETNKSTDRRTTGLHADTRSVKSAGSSDASGGTCRSRGGDKKSSNANLGDSREFPRCAGDASRSSDGNARLQRGTNGSPPPKHALSQRRGAVNDTRNQGGSQASTERALKVCVKRCNSHASAAGRNGVMLNANTVFPNSRESETESRRTEVRVDHRTSSQSDRTGCTRGHSTRQLTSGASRQSPTHTSRETETPGSCAVNGDRTSVPVEDPTTAPMNSRVAGEKAPIPSGGLSYRGAANPAASVQRNSKAVLIRDEGRPWYPSDEEDIKTEVEPSFADAPALSAELWHEKRKSRSLACSCSRRERFRDAEGATRGQSEGDTREEDEWGKREERKRGGKGEDWTEGEATMSTGRRGSERRQRGAAYPCRESEASACWKRAWGERERGNGGKGQREEDENGGLYWSGGRSIAEATRKEQAWSRAVAREREEFEKPPFDGPEEKTGGKEAMRTEECEETFEKVVVSRWCDSALLALPAEPPYEAWASDFHGSEADASSRMSLSPFRERSVLEQGTAEEDETQREGGATHEYHTLLRGRRRRQRTLDENEQAVGCRLSPSRRHWSAAAPSPIVCPPASARHTCPLALLFPHCSAERKTGSRPQEKGRENDEAEAVTIDGQRTGQGRVARRGSSGNVLAFLDGRRGDSRPDSAWPPCVKSRNRRRKAFSVEAYHGFPPSPCHASTSSASSSAPPSAPGSPPPDHQTEGPIASSSHRLSPSSSLSSLSAVSSSPASSVSSCSPRSSSLASPISPALEAETRKTSPQEAFSKTQKNCRSVPGCVDRNSRPPNPTEWRTHQRQSVSGEAVASALASSHLCAPLPRQQSDSPAQHGYLLFPADEKSEWAGAEEGANRVDLQGTQKTGKSIPSVSTWVCTTEDRSIHAVSSGSCTPETTRSSFSPRTQNAPRNSYSSDELSSGGIRNSYVPPVTVAGGSVAGVCAREVDTTARGEAPVGSDAGAMHALPSSKVTDERRGREGQVQTLSGKNAPSKSRSSVGGSACIPRRSLLEGEGRKGTSHETNQEAASLDGGDRFPPGDPDDDTVEACGQKLATSSFSSSGSGSPLSHSSLSPSPSSRGSYLSSRVAPSRSSSSTLYHSSFSASPGVSSSSLSSSSALLLASISSLPAASSVLTLAPPAATFFVSSSSYPSLPPNSKSGTATISRTSQSNAASPPSPPPSSLSWIPSGSSSASCAYGPSSAGGASSPVSVTSVEGGHPGASSLPTAETPHDAGASFVTEGYASGAPAAVHASACASAVPDSDSAPCGRDEETQNSAVPPRKSTESRVVTFASSSLAGASDEPASRPHASAVPPPHSGSSFSASPSSLTPQLQCSPPKTALPVGAGSCPPPPEDSVSALSSRVGVAPALPRRSEEAPPGAGLCLSKAPSSLEERRKDEGEDLRSSGAAWGRNNSTSEVKKTRNTTAAIRGDDAGAPGDKSDEDRKTVAGESTGKRGTRGSQKGKKSEEHTETKPSESRALKFDAAPEQGGEGSSGWCASSSFARHSVESVDEPGTKEKEEAYLGRETIELYLRPEEAEEFMKQVDFAGHGKINAEMFKRAILNIYNARKRLVRGLRSQGSVASTVLRMISLLLWFVCAVVMLLVIGVDMNTVIVSGAAFLSALTVALSYLYQHFVTAVIFVALTNPYNVGDRIRVDGGEILTVRKIRTYTTEFDTVHGRPVIYSNSVLFSKVLTNESRAKNSVLELKLRVGIGTPHCLIKALETKMRKFVEQRPMDFVKDSFWVVVHHYSLWMACVEGWGNYRKVLDLRSEVYFYLAKQVTKLGIAFHLAPQPVSITNAPAPILHMRPLVRNGSPSSPQRIQYAGSTAGSVPYQAAGHSMPPQGPVHASARQVLDGKCSKNRHPSQTRHYTSHTAPPYASYLGGYPSQTTRYHSHAPLPFQYPAATAPQISSQTTEFSPLASGGLGGGNPQTQTLSLTQRFQGAPSVTEKKGGLGSVTGSSGASFSCQHAARALRSGRGARDSTEQPDRSGWTEQTMKTEGQTHGRSLSQDHTNRGERLHS